MNRGNVSANIKPRVVAAAPHFALMREREKGTLGDMLRLSNHVRGMLLPGEDVASSLAWCVSQQ